MDGQGQAILFIQGRRFAADLYEEEMCRYQDSSLLESNPILLDPERGPGLGAFSSRSRVLPEVNPWFMLKDGGERRKPQISEVLQNVYKDKPIPVRKGSTCVFVGSRLFDLGGVGTSATTKNCLTNQIRHLDLLNVDDGWKTHELPVYLINPITVVSANFIYLFTLGGQMFKFRVRGDSSSSTTNSNDPWGCVYDTVSHQSHILGPPEPNLDPWQYVHSYIPREDGRVQICLVHGNLYDKPNWFVYDPNLYKWERIDSDCIRPGRFVASNTLVCVFDNSSINPIFHTYMIEVGGRFRYRGMVELPGLTIMDDYGSDFALVPVSDSDFSFLWYKKRRRPGSKVLRSYIMYARISVYFDDDSSVPKASLVKEAQIGIDADAIKMCIPYQMFHDDDDQRPSSSYLKDVEQEEEEDDDDDDDYSEIGDLEYKNLLDAVHNMENALQSLRRRLRKKSKKSSDC